MLDAGGLVRGTPSVEEACGSRNDPMLVVDGEGNLVTQRDDRSGTLAAREPSISTSAAIDEKPALSSGASDDVKSRATTSRTRRRGRLTGNLSWSGHGSVANPYSM
jgi:hypothetical protein